MTGRTVVMTAMTVPQRRVGALVLAASLAVALVATLVPAPTAAALPVSPAPADDHTAFFADGPLAGSGWSACPGITWSVDARRLPEAVRPREIRRLSAAVGQWAAAAGLDIRFAGEEPLSYDASRYLLVPGGPPRERHVYLAFLTPRQAPLLASPVVGLGNPSRVIAETREIVGGVAVFRSGFVADASSRDPDRLRNLYLHEFGHVMGLGHARTTANVMYPTIDQRVRLGPGDRSGARSLVRPCTVAQ